MIEIIHGNIVLVLGIILAVGLSITSIIMYQVYLRFTKGEFKSICLWTMLIMLSVTFHEIVMVVHPLIDKMATIQHTVVDLIIDFFVYMSFLLVVISSIVLISYFKKFSDRFGLVGKLRK